CTARHIFVVISGETLIQHIQLGNAAVALGGILTVCRTQPLAVQLGGFSPGFFLWALAGLYRSFQLCLQRFAQRFPSGILLLTQCQKSLLCCLVFAFSVSFTHLLAILCFAFRNGAALERLKFFLVAHRLVPFLCLNGVFDRLNQTVQFGAPV